MSKLEVMPEKSENISSAEKGFLNIKPNEYVSDGDMADLIKREFAGAHEISQFDAYDRLLSEVFNRSEEEISIEFQPSNKTKKILESFRLDKWESLGDSEKISAIEKITKAVGDDLGLEKIPEIRISDDDDSYGFYNHLDNTITLNSRSLTNPIEVVNTLAHELRHAYQHMRAEKLESWEDALFKVNFDNYISPVPLPDGGWIFFVDYYDQYVEVDARVFADKVTEALA